MFLWITLLENESEVKLEFFLVPTLPPHLWSHCSAFSK